jgi:hypothetical protein
MNDSVKNQSLLSTSEVAALALNISMGSTAFTLLCPPMRSLSGICLLCFVVSAMLTPAVRLRRPKRLLLVVGGIGVGAYIASLLFPPLRVLQFLIVALAVVIGVVAYFRKPRKSQPAVETPELHARSAKV